MTSPQLSVVMPVYNGEKYLIEAIDSVLKQTFTDFELLIINDGSTDGSAELLKTIVDKRVRVVNNDVNRGVAYCRNLGLTLSNGKYVAWTDCDDINELSRFEKQVNFLDKHVEIGVCGTALARFGNEERYVFRPETDADLLKALLVFRPSIPNATAMLRLSQVREFQVRYNDNLPIAEDYDFIFSCSQVMKFTNLKSVLYHYRASESSIMKSVSGDQIRQREIHYVVYRRILAYLGLDPTVDRLNVHYMTTSECLIRSHHDLQTCVDWLKEISSANLISNRYEKQAFERAVSREFYYVCKKASPLGISVLDFYFRMCLSEFQIAPPLSIVKLIGRCLLRKDTI